MLGSMKKKIARRVIWGMNMKNGESLLLRGGSHEQELMEEMAITAMKQGNDVMTGMGSDNLAERVYSEIPLHYFKKTSKLSLKLMEAVNNYVGIERLKDPRVAEKFPPKKIAASQQANEPIQKNIEKYKIKTCVVGYPTKEMAAKLNIKFSLLEKFIFNGMLISYKDLMKKANFLYKNLVNADYAHAYDEYGTDLRLRIKGRRPLVDDGFISNTDIKNKDLHSNLPCGEIFLAPMETYGKGVLVSPKRTDVYTGKMIENIKLVFEKGRLNLKKTSAEKNEKALKTTLKNSMSVDRKLYKKVRTINVAELGIGMNPVIDKIIGYLLTDEKIGGTIHVAIGENYRFPSGRSHSCLHWDFISNKGINLSAITGGKEKIIIENGKCCF
jgi:aminopeptidase